MPLTREGLEATTAFWKKKCMKKNRIGELIEPAAVCSTYQTSWNSSCCTGFFFFLYKRWAEESQAKTRTKCLLCPSVTKLLACRQWYLLWDFDYKHFDASCIHFAFLFITVFKFSHHSEAWGTQLHASETQYLILFNLVTPLSAKGSKNGHLSSDYRGTYKICVFLNGVKWEFTNHWTLSNCSGVMEFKAKAKQTGMDDPCQWLRRANAGDQWSSIWSPDFTLSLLGWWWPFLLLVLVEFWLH